MQLRIQKIENITYIHSVLVQVLPVVEYATCVAFSNNNVFASTKGQSKCLNEIYKFCQEPVASLLFIAVLQFTK